MRLGNVPLVLECCCSGFSLKKRAGGKSCYVLVAVALRRGLYERISLLRNDAAILLSQVLAYYVYVYNLYLKEQLKHLKIVGTIAICILPLVLLACLLTDKDAFASLFLNDAHIPSAWLIFGTVSYSLFTIRYLYQSYISHHAGQSLLPLPFWYISIVAAVSVQVYGIYRSDIVLIVTKQAVLSSIFAISCFTISTRVNNKSTPSD